MASEQAFWKNFCEGVGRPELFERWPGSKFADHARGNLELRADPASRSSPGGRSPEWLEFGGQHNTPIAPVNTPKTIGDDPQFQDRMSWLPASELGADMLPDPDQVRRRDDADPDQGPDASASTPTRCCTDVLGYDEARMAELRAAGALG